jgi:transposase
MGRSTDLSSEEKNRIIFLRESGLSVTSIIQATSRSRNAINSCIRRWKTEGSLVSKRKNCGRKKILTPRELRKLFWRVSHGRRSTLKDLQQHMEARGDCKVSTRTIRRILHRFGFSSRFAVRKPLIIQRNAKKRVSWARHHKSWTKGQWRSVIWSDEACVELILHAKFRIWQKQGERFLHTCLAPSVQGCGGSVAIWACFSWKMKGSIVLIDGKLNSIKYISILKNNLIPCINKYFKRMQPTFQDDDSPVHRSLAVRKWFAEKKNMNHISRPSYSPDMNLIENLWALLKASVHKITLLLHLLMN